VDVDLRRSGGQGAAGEDDRITNVENVTAGTGSDHLVGTAGPNRLDGGGTYPNAVADVIRGLAGDDDIRVGDGGDVDAGPGDDTVQHFAGRRRATDPARVRCGEGRDLVVYPSPYLMTAASCEQLKLRRADTISGPRLRARADGRARGLRYTCGAGRKRARPRRCEIRLRLRFTTRSVGGTWSSGGHALGSSRGVAVAAGRTRDLTVRLGPDTRVRLARARSLPVRVLVQVRYPPQSRRWYTTGSFVTTVHAAR